MAGFHGVIKDVVKEGAETVAKGAVKTGAKGAGAVTKVQKGLYQKALDSAGARAIDGADTIVSRAVNKNLGESVSTLTARAEKLGKIAETGVIEKAAKESSANVVENAGKEAGKEIGKKVSNGIGKNALIGGAVGSVTGAGIGGVTAMATGADEDDTKSMILMGALAGGAAGSIAGAGSKMIRNKQATGSMWQQAAEEMSKHGGKNLPVGGGANGLIEKVKNGGTNIADKIDNFGQNISNRYSKGAKLEQVNLINDIKRANPEMTTSKILKDLKSGEGILSGIYNENAENIAQAVHKGNILGGSAQGALMGSAGGALIGGVAGGIDEDESFIGGALKGGLIGGTLGGIGGGVSGHFNNSAKILSNTVENVGSLFA